MITIKSPREIDTMAAAGAIVAETLALVARHTTPGVATAELDRIAEEFIRSHPGARPSFKGLYDYPATLCTSINNEVVHGIPSSNRVLKTGDLLSVDVGVWLDGLHADSAATFPVGAVSVDAERLLATTRTALAAGAARAPPRAGDDHRHRADGEPGRRRHPHPRRQVDGGHRGRLALRPLRAHGGHSRERWAAAGAHDRRLISLSSRAIASSIASPCPGSDRPARFTRMFSIAPATAARASASATFASERAFLLPISAISRASVIS